MKRLQGVIAVAVGVLLGFLSLVVFSACGPTQPLNIENIDLSDDAPQVQAPQAETPQPEAIQSETPDDTQLASTDDINRSAEPAVAADAPAGDPSQKSAPVEPGDWPRGFPSACESSKNSRAWSKSLVSGPLRFGLPGDRSVVLDSAIATEVKDAFLVGTCRIQVAAVNDQFVL